MDQPILIKFHDITCNKLQYGQPKPPKKPSTVHARADYYPSIRTLPSLV